MLGDAHDPDGGLLLVLGYVSAPSRLRFESRKIRKVAVLSFRRTASHHHGHWCAGQASSYVLGHGIMGPVALHRQLGAQARLGCGRRCLKGAV